MNAPRPNSPLNWDPPGTMFPGTLLPRDRATVDAAFAPGFDPAKAARVVMREPDLLSFMSPEALVCMLPFLRSACEEHTDDGFDLFMALEFMFATARLKDPEMAEHFLEIDRLLAPAEKIETLAFFSRYASSSPHLAPGHSEPLRLGDPG